MLNIKRNLEGQDRKYDLIKTLISRLCKSIHEYEVLGQSTAR